MPPLRAIIKVEFGDGLRLGPGKAQLLELIDQHGSISAAARAMNMSYRRAWLLIEELNQMFGEPAIYTAAGGTGGGGAKLTPHGRKVMMVFRDLEKQAASLMEEGLTQAFKHSRGDVK